jgi:hypothetical protein
MKTGLPIIVLKEAACVPQATGQLLKGILLTPQLGNVGKSAFNRFYILETTIYSM